MWVFAVSAAWIGLIHSLSPGHWLPVVLIAKAKKWSLKIALVGALVAASGHLVLSLLVALISALIESQFLIQYEEWIEHYSGWSLIVLGFIYTLMSFFRQVRCHHHGSEEACLQIASQSHRAAFGFLFSLGLSPCVAVLPVVAQAAVHGAWVLIGTLMAFTVGVLVALLGATGIVTLGFVQLNHSWLDRYGDVLAGIGVVLTGFVLVFYT